MVSGFISSVQGHIVKDKFVVLAKVRNSQRMNDLLIPMWIITEKQGTVISAHCCDCKADLGNPAPMELAYSFTSRQGQK